MMPAYKKYANNQEVGIFLGDYDVAAKVIMGTLNGDN
jgi:hypothetical protein